MEALFYVLFEYLDTDAMSENYMSDCEIWSNDWRGPYVSLREADDLRAYGVSDGLTTRNLVVVRKYEPIKPIVESA